MPRAPYSPPPPQRRERAARGPGRHAAAAVAGPAQPQQQQQHEPAGMAAGGMTLRSGKRARARDDAMDAYEVESAPAAAPDLPRPRAPKRRAPAPPREQVCAHCAETSTPQWRRDADTGADLCNRCALRQQRDRKRAKRCL